MKQGILLQPVRENVLRVVYTAQKKPTEPGFIIEKQPAFDGECAVKAGQNGEAVFFTKDGEPLFAQLACELEPEDVLCYTFQGSKPKIVVKKTVDGERAFVENAETMKIGTAFKGTVRFSVAPDEAVYGLGQNENGVYNYRGVKEYLYQNNMKIPMPVFVSSKNYAVLFDCACMMTYSEQDGVMEMKFDAVNQIDYYIITGSCFDELIQGIRTLTGRAAMLPRWAFGYVQSRERYKTQQEILDTAREFEERKIPVSCLVLDWLSWEEGKWGNKIVDKSRFPDLKGMVDKLHQKDIAFMISVWPNCRQGCENNEELAQAGKLMCDLSTYNAFDEEARKIYWKQCEQELFPAGTDAWWCDSTEPFTPDWNGEVKRGEAERYELAGESLKRYMDARQANAYALMHAKGIFENQLAASEKKRVAILTRSGWASSQKYGVILWSGDIAATWDCMRRQIAEGLSMCLSGNPYWTLDIGAFFAGSTKSWRKWSSRTDGEAPWFWHGDFEDGVQDYGYRELYVRWLQMGAFLPVMRSHGTDTPREPWNFGEPGTLYYDTIVKYIKLRYRILPYIYSLAAKAHFEGYTIMRSLMFDFAGDENVKNIADQFMLGGAFLACPVTKPMDYAPCNTKLANISHMRPVYLPGGACWWDYETKAKLTGGQWLEADAPVNKMPLFVRAGSVIPVSDNDRGGVHGVEIYAGADGRFDLYCDNGTDYSCDNGAYCSIPLVWNQKEGTLTVGDAQGDYPYPEKLEVTLFEGSQAIRKSLAYHGKAVTLKLR